jgi:2-methylcitrate dehydratase PrpD
MIELTRELAEWPTRTSYEDLPQEVTEKVKYCMLDAAGVALAAVSDDVGRGFRSILPEIGGPGPCTVLGSPESWNPLAAGLVNGSLGHALDYDDTYQPVPVHTSGSIFPASLAVAERQQSPGKDLLRAMALGTETAIRIGLALGRSHVDKGWHGTGTFNTFGAATATGLLIGLTAEQMIRCLGTSAVQATGLLKAAAGTKCKPLHAGKAAMNGILAGLLASTPGWTAPDRALEMPNGFAALFSDGPELEVGLGDLGKRYYLTDISFKISASCSQTQATIDGVEDLRQKHDIDPEAVQEIILTVNPIAGTVAGIPEPEDGFQGKFSLAYCAALALHGHDRFQEAFSKAMVDRPELQAACRKVKLNVVPGMGDVETNIEIRLKDGKKFSTYVPVARGNPGNELSKEELEGKFVRLVEPLFGPKSTRNLVSIFLNCEEMQDVRELGNLLRQASLKGVQNACPSCAP